MAKKAVGGQKKTKDQIAKAANAKKGGVKKWTKGKAKEKADHAVFISKAVYDKIVGTIPALGRFISVSVLVDKFKIVGSVARGILKKCLESGVLDRVDLSSKQAIYTPSQAALEKIVVEKDSKKDKAPKAVLPKQAAKEAKIEKAAQ